MKKIIGLIAFVLLISTLGACGDKETSSGSGSSKSEVKVTVGTDATYAPFEYMDKGELTGFDIELLNAIAKEAGIKIEYKNIGWDPLFAAVQGKQVDFAISSCTITPERQQTYDFSDNYFLSTNMILIKEGSSVKSASDLKGKKVGVLNASTGQAAIEKLYGKNNKDLKKYESNPLAIMALKNNEVEAVVCDNTVAEAYVKNNPNDKLVSLSDTTNFANEFYGIMFPKGSKYTSKINDGIQKVLDNGKYAEIYKKYFDSEPDVTKLK